MLYDILTSWAKPSSNSQLSHCSWSIGIFDETHWYKTKHSVGWQIAIKAKIEFKLQVTATPGFHSLHYWWYQMMWLFSDMADNSENDTAMEKNGAEVSHSAVKRVMHGIRTDHIEAQQDAAHQMLQIAKPSTIKRWLELKLDNGNWLIWILNKIAHLINPQWTEVQQPKQPVERGALSCISETSTYTPRCISSTKGAIFSSSCPSLSFEVVANQVSCASCGYSLHVCRNEQWWAHRNAAQIVEFTKSLCIRNYTPRGPERRISFSSTLHRNDSEVLGMDWAAAGIYMSCPA